MREFTPTMQELNRFYNEDLNKYKTASSKKAFLTRSLKQVEEYHDDLVRAYQTSHRMFLGEKVNRIDIMHAVNEIKLIRKLYSEI